MKAVVFLWLLLGIWSFLHAEQSVEFDYELDAYYSDVSMFIDLDSEHNLTDATNYTELQLYTNLVKKTFQPNIFLIEASIHPVSIGGLYFRQNHENMYKRSKIDDFNLVKALTAGFEEPYAISFFLGRMMVFQNSKSDHIGKNRAYMGYLVTIGDNTIKDNLVHWDRWVNFEFKLKGTRERHNTDLDWSFRVGSRIHENNNFVNNIYIGARRSSIDYNKKILSFFYNSDFNTMVACSADRFNLTEARISIGKKYPMTWPTKMSFGLEIGYLYISGEKYRGELKEEGIDNHQFIFRPNFKW